MAAIFQRTFSTVFSWMKMYDFRFRFHWNVFPGVQLTIFPYWFRSWLGASQATNHYLEQWWSSLLTHMCVSGPQWAKKDFGKLWPRNCLYGGIYFQFSIVNYIFHHFCTTLRHLIMMLPLLDLLQVFSLWRISDIYVTKWKCCRGVSLGKA